MSTSLKNLLDDFNKYCMRRFHLCENCLSGLSERAKNRHFHNSREDRVVFSAKIQGPGNYSIEDILKEALWFFSEEEAQVNCSDVYPTWVLGDCLQAIFNEWDRRFTSSGDKTKSVLSLPIMKIYLTPLRRRLTHPQNKSAVPDYKKLQGFSRTDELFFPPGNLWSIGKALRSEIEDLKKSLK